MSRTAAGWQYRGMCPARKLTRNDTKTLGVWSSEQRRLEMGERTTKSLCNARILLIAVAATLSFAGSVTPANAQRAIP
jgi:hypothetical protein